MKRLLSTSGMSQATIALQITFRRRLSARTVAADAERVANVMCLWECLDARLLWKRPMGAPASNPSLTPSFTRTRVPIHEPTPLPHLRRDARTPDCPPAYCGGSPSEEGRARQA